MNLMKASSTGLICYQKKFNNNNNKKAKSALRSSYPATGYKLGATYKQTILLSKFNPLVS